MSGVDKKFPSKRVTAADVARSIGLSRATVGFVFNDTPGQTIPESTRRRVFAEAQRLGYKPHTAARALASGRSHIVLILLPDWPVDYSMRANLDEASLVLDRAGYSMVTMTPHPGGQAVPLWESLSPEVVIALAPLSDAQHSAIVATGAHTLVPGRDALELGRELHFEEGPSLQVEHLVNSGRHQIAFVGTTDPRLQDLVSQRSGLADKTHRAITGRPLVASVAVNESTVGSTLAELVNNGVDGIVAYNDDVGALVLGAAIRASLPVPGTLAIVGHDDTPLARLVVPALSSVRVDTAGLGRFLAELALSRVTASDYPQAGPEATAVLVRRETS
ncbi:LacI family DNA-binding transcriptional regulator [Microbacterium sp. A588]